MFLGLGVLLAIIPYPTVGSQFLPNGAICFVLGLLFTLAFVRNETEAKFRTMATNVLGGVGGLLAFVGFVWSNIYGQQFLLPYGVILILSGFVFLWAFISLRGVADDLGYWIGVGVGVVGLTVLLIALGRSRLPAILEKMKWITPTAGYTMPNGVVLMLGGFLYLCLALGYCSDRQFVVLTRRELARCSTRRWPTWCCWAMSLSAGSSSPTSS